MRTQHARKLCAISADNDILSDLKTAASQVGLDYDSRPDCSGCGPQCASIVAVDASSTDLEKVVAQIPRSDGNVLVGILPSSMPVAACKPHGIEVIVYRDLMQRFLTPALQISVLLVEGEESQRRRSKRTRLAA